MLACLACVFLAHSSLSLFLFISFARFCRLESTGAFFDQNDADALDTFKIAIARQNTFNTDFRLEPIIKQITAMDGFQAEQAGDYSLSSFFFNSIGFCLYLLLYFWTAHNYR